MLKITETVAPDKRAAFANVNLSRNTVVQRVVDLATDLTTYLEEKAQNCLAYSLATYKSADVTDTAQLSLCIRGGNPDLAVTEELLCMPTLHDITKGSDLFSAIEACVYRYNLPWDKL